MHEALELFQRQPLKVLLFENSLGSAIAVAFLKASRHRLFGFGDKDKSVVQVGSQIFFIFLTAETFLGQILKNEIIGSKSN